MSSFAIIRSGILEWLIRGEIGYGELGAYTVIQLQADFRTGIWWGSAPRLQAGSRESLRDVQRWLQRLKEIGFLRPFHEHGARGNYPVLINKYDVRIGALKGKRLNAWKSEGWEHPCYEVCADPVAEAAPIQYPVSSNQEKPSPPAVRRAPSEDALTLTTLLKQGILKNNPTARITTTQEAKWASVVDLMLRRDGRTFQQIREHIEWSQSDSFWHRNILSMSKLRDKFDQLTTNMNAPLRKEASNGKLTSTELALHNARGLGIK